MSSLSLSQIRMALEASGARYVSDEALGNGNHAYVFAAESFTFMVFAEGKQSDGSFSALLKLAIFNGSVPLVVANDLNTKFYFNRAYVTEKGLMVEKAMPLSRASTYQVGLSSVLFINEIERYVI
ncbi:type III secretion system chaperone family protein [Woodsholea maritima]|uniref:hypothetical protein n=1 Tax=Woodsholea maritima TaxID=240237 RepID=UPI0003661106|nr:hypothetical protein [Woodsholea maritima]